eukprot:gene5670-biopygen3492
MALCSTGLGHQLLARRSILIVVPPLCAGDGVGGLDVCFAVPRVRVVQGVEGQAGHPHRFGGTDVPTITGINKPKIVHFVCLVIGDGAMAAISRHSSTDERLPELLVRLLDALWDSALSRFAGGLGPLSVAC